MPMERSALQACLQNCMGECIEAKTQCSEADGAVLREKCKALGLQAMCHCVAHRWFTQQGYPGSRQES